MYECMSVGENKLNMISASGITGVASHGKHTRATEHVKKVKQNCPASGYGNFVLYCHMFGDSVYAYHEFATRKNVGSCPLPGS